MKIKYIYISPFSPSAKHGAGALLRNVMNSQLKNQMVWFSLSDLDTSYESVEVYTSGFLMRLFHSFRFAKIRRLFNGLISSFESRIVYLKFRYILKRYPSIKKAIFYCHPSYFHIYRYILKKQKIDFHLTIHDNPFNTIKLESRIGYSLDNVQKDMSFFIKNASSVDCISERMLNLFGSFPAKNNAIVQKGKFLPADISDELLFKKNNIKKLESIIISSIGNAWTTELRELDDDSVVDLLNCIKNMRKKKKEISFHITTPYFPYETKYLFISRHDYLSDKELQKLLEETTIGYAYDPFTDVLIEFAKYSFPSKIVTYVTNGIPFIYHGSQNSPVSDLVEKYRCGVVVDSRSPDLLESAIGDIVSNYEQYQKQCASAWLGEFDLDKIQEEFSRVIEV